MPDDHEALSLKEACTFALEEARTVVPGIQALLGFELIAVFSERFESGLGDAERGVHLAAMLLSALACALLLAPAAYHRQVGGREVSERLLGVISHFVRAAMIAMMLAVSTEVYVVSRLVFDAPAFSVVLAVATLAVFVWAWMLYPSRSRRGR